MYNNNNNIKNKKTTTTKGGLRGRPSERKLVYISRPTYDDSGGNVMVLALP